MRRFVQRNVFCEDVPNVMRKSLKAFLITRQRELPTPSSKVAKRNGKSMVCYQTLSYPHPPKRFWRSNILITQFVGSPLSTSFDNHHQYILAGQAALKIYPIIDSSLQVQTLQQNSTPAAGKKILLISCLHSECDSCALRRTSPVNIIPCLSRASHQVGRPPI